MKKFPKKLPQNLFLEIFMTVQGLDKKEEMEIIFTY
jgi:hypothetical protein